MIVAAPFALSTGLIAALAFTISMNTSSNAQSDQNSCITQLTRNPALILFHRPTRRLTVFKSGRKVKEVTVTNNPSAHLLPDGVYTLLEEHTDRLRSRFQFVPRLRKKKIEWRGTALFAEGSTGLLGRSQSIELPTPFSKELLEITAAGAVLVVATAPSALAKFDDIEFFEEPESDHDKGAQCNITASGWATYTELAPKPPVAVVISERDRKAYFYLGGVLQDAFDVIVEHPHRETGRHLFVAIKTAKGNPERTWLAVSLAGGGFEAPPSVSQADEVLSRFSFKEDAQDTFDEFVNRGLVLLVQERSAEAESKNPKLIYLMRSRN